MVLNFILMLLQKKCEHSAATSDVPKIGTSVSKLKRKLGNNTESPAATQTKQARVTSRDKLASHSADVCHSKLGLVTFYYFFFPKMFKIPGTRLPWQLNFVWWCFICVWILNMEHLSCHHSGA
jgi:hypothetical protein